MILPKTAEYALRAMALLASRQGEVIPSSEIAQSALIPEHYLSKVMRQLVVAGLVGGRRGRGGGFWLARPPSEVRYSDVFDAVGGVHDPERCAFGNDHCDVEHPCPLHHSWVDLQERFGQWADCTTLADPALPPTR